MASSTVASLRHAISSLEIKAYSRFMYAYVSELKAIAEARADARTRALIWNFKHYGSPVLNPEEVTPEEPVMVTRERRFNKQLLASPMASTAMTDHSFNLESQSAITSQQQNQISRWFAALGQIPQVEPVITTITDSSLYARRQLSIPRCERSESRCNPPRAVEISRTQPTAPHKYTTVSRFREHFELETCKLTADWQPGGLFVPMQATTEGRELASISPMDGTQEEGDPKVTETRWTQASNQNTTYSREKMEENMKRLKGSKTSSRHAISALVKALFKCQREETLAPNATSLPQSSIELQPNRAWSQESRHSAQFGVTMQQGSKHGSSIGITYSKLCHHKNHPARTTKAQKIMNLLGAVPCVFQKGSKSRRASQDSDASPKQVRNSTTSKAITPKGVRREEPAKQLSAEELPMRHSKQVRRRNKKICEEHGLDKLDAVKVEQPEDPKMERFRDLRADQTEEPNTEQLDERRVEQPRRSRSSVCSLQCIPEEDQLEI